VAEQMINYEEMQASRRCGAWWLSGRFGALCPECRIPI